MSVHSTTNRLTPINFNDNLEGIEDQLDDKSDVPAIEEASPTLVKALRNRNIAVNPKKRSFSSVETEFAKKKSRSKSEKIVGRDKELARIIRMLAQATPQRPLLIGAPGVGKTTIIRKLEEELTKESCPAPLKGRKIEYISCKKIAAEVESEQGAADVFSDVKEEIEANTSNPIFCLEDIDELTHDRSVALYFETLLPFLPFLIGIISDTEKSEKVNTTKKVLGRYNFEPLVVKELSVNETHDIVRLHTHKTSITDDTIKFAISLAGTHLKKQPFPVKALSVISEATTAAALESGRAHSTVEPRHIAEVMGGRTNIPAHELMETDLGKLEKLYTFMRSQLVGQNHALEILHNGIKREKLGFRDSRKPQTYFFMGGTGVGKTQLAKLLADGLNRHFIRLDMSEYFEEHSAAKLIGSPPGYESNDLGGGFTNELREYPQSIVVIDESEKAHPNVIRVFLQVFDEGRLTDGRGVTADCTNAIFIMTSNLGSDTIFAHNRKVLTEAKLQEGMFQLIEKQWSPEFLSRITAVVPFRNLTEEDYPEVIGVHLKKFAEEIYKIHDIKVVWITPCRSYFLEKYRSALRTGVRGLCEKVKIELYDALAKAKTGGILDNCKKINLSIEADAIKVAVAE